jgi:hypothetical protein
MQTIQLALAPRLQMKGATPLLPLYAFTMCIWTSLPFTSYLSLHYDIHMKYTNHDLHYR